MEKRDHSPNEIQNKQQRIDEKSDAVPDPSLKINKEAIALGTEEEEVGIEFDGKRKHHCWTDRELFKDTRDF